MLLNMAGTENMARGGGRDDTIHHLNGQNSQINLIGAVAFEEQNVMDFKTNASKIHSGAIVIAIRTRTTAFQWI